MLEMWRRGRRRLVLSGAAVCVGLVTLAAVATAQAPGWAGMHHRDGAGRPGAMWSPALRQLHVAERLAGLEIMLQITPEQQPQWRAFTAALLAMMPERPPPSADAFAAIDQMTARVAAMAEPAQHLHDAAGALKAVLSPEQIAKADAVWAAMRPHGPQSHVMGMHDMGPHDMELHDMGHHGGAAGAGPERPPQP